MHTALVVALLLLSESVYLAVRLLTYLMQLRETMGKTGSGVDLELRLRSGDVNGSFPGKCGGWSASEWFFSFSIARPGVADPTSKNKQVMGRRMPFSISSVSTCMIIEHDTIPTPWRKTNKQSRKSALMMSLLRNILLQERQKRVGPGDFGTSIPTFSGSDRRGGKGFGLIVLRELRSEVNGEDGSLGFGGGGELFYGTDVVIGCLQHYGGERVPGEH